MLEICVFLALITVGIALPPRNPNEHESVPTTAPPSTTPATGFCGNPPTIAHSSISGEGPPYEEGTPLLYVCDAGYYLDGSPYSRCLNAEWDGPIMSCQPKSCSDPGYPANGYRHSSDFTYGARVFFYCNEGYQLTGDTYVTCQVDTKWSGSLPVCTAIKDVEVSPVFQEKGSGEVLPDETKGIDVDITSTIKKEEYDYETIPSKPIDQEVIIDGHRENSAIPLNPDSVVKVSLVDSGKKDVDMPNTYVTISSRSKTETWSVSSPYSHPPTVAYPDYNTRHIKPTPPQTNNRNSWQTEISASGATSIENTDHDLGLGEHDVITAQGRTETLDIDEDDELTVDPGSEPPEITSGSGSGFSSGDVDEEIEVGVFTTPPVPVYCGAPPLLRNAMHDGSGVPYQDGSYITYTCVEGFFTEGYSHVSCRNGSWDNPRFNCVDPPKIKECGEPSVPPNGYKHGQVYTVGSHVFYNCNEGYELVGENYRTCLPNQTWDGQLPTCKVRGCVDPGELPNGYRQGYDYSFGSVVFYFCDEGYELVGNSNLTCQTDQTWSTPRPTCRERSCGTPLSISNGYYSGSEFTTGGRVFYYCENGYHLVGENYMFCGTDQKWSGLPPSCIAKNCGDPGYILNGYRQGSEFTVGARVHFFCNQGFELIGKHYRTCLISQQWSDSVPVCKEIEEVIVDNNTEERTVAPTESIIITDDEDFLPDLGSGGWPSGGGSGIGVICDENTCKYGGVCFPSAVQFQCVCNFTCVDSASEVTCGSDGRVYGNQCEIRLAACRTQRLITSAPNEMCEELQVEQVLPLCGMETETEPGWSDWSLWIRSGSKDIRFRHCRSDKARPDGRSHCAGHDIQTRLCGRERSNVCRSDNGTLGYEYRYKCKGVDGHDLPDSNEVFMGNNSYEDCWFSLYAVKNSKYKYFHWSYSQLLKEGNVQNWCHKRNQFIPFYPAHGYCEMALHYFCHSQSKCWYEEDKKTSKPDDRLDTCWTKFAFGGRPPTTFEDNRASHSVICQKFSSSGSFGTMFGEGVAHYATLYDTYNRIPIFSMTTIERMSDGGWPVVPYLLERGLIDEGEFISWLFSSPEKGLTSQYELPNKFKEDLCKLGKNQALYDDYKLSGFRVGPLIIPGLTGCHPSAKVASFALTNSVPMHLTQYYAWTSAMEGVQEYAIKQCGITMERDHTGVYCQYPEEVKSSLYLVSGAVASHEPREVIGNNVNVPSLVWMAGCCVDVDGAKVKSFAFYLMNKVDFPLRKVTVSALENLLTAMTDPSQGGGIPVKIFPSAQGICGSPQNDDSVHLSV